LYYGERTKYVAACFCSCAACVETLHCTGLKSGCGKLPNNNLILGVKTKNGVECSAYTRPEC
jgi:hypothetical protein